MYFFNFRKKLGFSFLVSIIALFSVVSIALGDAKEAGKFNFLLDNSANFFIGNNFAQSSSLENSKTELSAKSDNDNNIFDQFDTWVKSYNAKTTNGLQLDSQEISVGENLAIQRREQLKQLIVTNPQLALQKSLSEENLKALPTFISSHLEQHISATGDFLVYELCGLNSVKTKKGSKLADASRTVREVVIGADKYQAYVYGRRETMTTKMAIPISGIAIDDAMAVDESPARVLNESATDQSTIGGEGKTVEIGGKVVYFSNQAELDSFVQEEINWEATIGPERTKTNAVKSFDKDAPQANNQPESSWTVGPKKVLVIRVDFPDKQGDPLDYSGNPLTQSRAQDLFTNQVNPFYVSNSYGQTSITATVTPMLIRMSQPESYYIQENNFDILTQEARTKASQSGYDYNNYDLDVITVSYLRITTGANTDLVGLSSIGARGSILNGAFFLSEAAHELGHNYGLLHANLWRTTDGTPIGQGYDVEYGDCYDMMAAWCTNSTSSFNVRYKRLLDWLTDANVQTLTNDGTYTIYAQDASSQSGIKALKINKDSTRNYWIEFRQGMNGALIRWDLGSQNFQQTELLDMHPNTSTINDAALLVGETFNDYENGITITVLGKNNTSPESINIKVGLNLPNSGCTYSLSSNSISYPKEGGSGSFNVFTKPDCDWTASSSNPLALAVTSGGNGTGNGTVYFTLQPTTSTSSREETITVNGQIFTITQAGSNDTTNNCSYTVNPSSFNISASGGALNYTQGYTGTGCSNLMPSSVGTSNWININSNPITVAPNTGPARSGNLVLTASNNGTQVQTTITINQASGCVFPLNPISKDFNSSGGTDIFSIKSSNSECLTTYSAASNNSWITISNPSGQSNDNISYTVTPNTGSSRSGTITVNNPVTGNQTLTINQSAGGCIFSLTPANIDFGEGGGQGSLNISSSADCPTKVISNNSWIVITDPGNAVGGGTVKFLVGSNSSSARTGTIAVAGSTITINQTAGSGKSRKRVRFF